MKLRVLYYKIMKKLFGSPYYIKELRCQGAEIGENCHIYGYVDNGHSFLVSMGNNVTLASKCMLLTHDGSTKKILGYSKVGRIDIGNDVFVGAYSIILPNVHIGDRVIIGAGTIVTKDIPDNSVVVGNPAKIIGTYEDYVRKNENLLKNAPIQNTYGSQKTTKGKKEMKDALKNGGFGFDE